MTPLEQKFVSFIDSLKLKNFSGKEMLPYFSRTRKGIKNSLPPIHLWPNIVPTLVVAQAIRDIVGPLKIVSSYRSPDYNAAVGGERMSYHMSFDALDLQSSNTSASFLHATAIAQRGKSFTNPLTGKRFKYAGGIGKYPTFVHIDDRGTDANW